MLTQNSCNAILDIKIRWAFLVDLITVKYFEFKYLFERTGRVIFVVVVFDSQTMPGI